MEVDCQKHCLGYASKNKPLTQVEKCTSVINLHHLFGWMYRAQLCGMKRSIFKGGTRYIWLEKHHWKPPQANAAIEWDRSLHNHHIALLLFWDVFCATVQLSCSSVPCCIQPVWCHTADTPHGGNYGNTCLPFKNAALKWILWYILWRLCVVTLCCVSGTCWSVLKRVFVFVYFLFQENSISLLLPSVYNHSTRVLHILWRTNVFGLGWQSWTWSLSRGADSWDRPQAHI